MKNCKVIVIERVIANDEIAGKWEHIFPCIEDAICYISKMDKLYSRQYVKFEYQIIEIR